MTFTSKMVGKEMYLIDFNLIKKGEILCVSRGLDKKNMNGIICKLESGEFVTVPISFIGIKAFFNENDAKLIGLSMRQNLA